MKEKPDEKDKPMTPEEITHWLMTEIPELGTEVSHDPSDFLPERR